MAKFKFHMKSFSSSNTETDTQDSIPELPQKEQRTPREYFVSLRDRSFFTLRRTQSQRNVTINTTKGSSPFTFSARSRGNASPKTPQFGSLFGPKAPPRSENNRHHRQYAVSLSHLSRMQGVALHDEPSASLDPESPSELTRLRRLNPRRTKSPKVPPVIITAPSGEALGLEEIREPSLKDDIVAHFRPIPPLDLKTPPSYRSREHSTVINGVLPEITSTSKDDISFEAARRQDAMSGLHRIAEILQGAARSLDGDPAFSRAMVFRYLAPLVSFISVLILGIVIPRYFSIIKDVFGVATSLLVPTIALVAIGFSLVMLEGCLRVACKLCQSFCELDLDAVFRKNEIQDTNGKSIGGLDLVAGIFAADD
ncbi:hypothetical protein JR316_0002931 [Psilocybe cubensis]|uniref:Uncharacterized protein n=2 Tax=Psilocybe cubensis TaxID=181762 RepID=A0ACB8H6P5_PSICU|nr:hypothetical protein JR316_0002931 [Psilocybe cubensis]KAH9483463.1 hypothetical protein JR316_0002931 [Psilocybe cubensis]